MIRGTRGNWERPRNRAALSATLFVLSLVIHTVVWIQYGSDPFHTGYVSDALSYHEWAGRIAANGLTGEPVFHQAPLFPLMLAGLYRLTSPDAADLAIWMQIVLTSLAIAALVPIGRLYLGSVRVGAAAGVLALGYSPFAFYSMKLLPIPLALATQAGAIALLGAARGPRSRWFAPAAGLACGVACLARSEFLLFLPVALLALVLDRSHPRQERRVRIGLFLVGAVVAIAPVTKHNMAHGDRVLVASAAGENLFIGNQRGGDGGHNPLHPQAGDLFSQRALARRVAEQETGGPMRPSAISRYWSERALDEVVADPLGWLGLEWRKLRRIFDPTDPTDMYSLPLERSLYLGSLYLLPLSTFGLWILAAIGCGLAWRRFPESAWPLFGVVVLHLSVLLAFFVSSRLRIPWLFFLTPFAGLTLVEAVTLLRSRRRLRLGFGIAVLVLLGSLHWLLFMQPTPREAVRLASVLSRQERLDEALAIVEPWSRGTNPDGLALDQAGWIHSKKGQSAIARGMYERALTVGLPSTGREAQTRSRLAALHERDGAWLRAAQQHDMAVRLAPDSAGARHERGLFRLRRDRTADAIEDFIEAARLAPGWAEPRRALRSLGVSVPADETTPRGDRTGHVR